MSLITSQDLMDLVWLLYSPPEVLFSLEKEAEGKLWLANTLQFTLSHDPFTSAGKRLNILPWLAWMESIQGGELQCLTGWIVSGKKCKFTWHLNSFKWVCLQGLRTIWGHNVTDKYLDECKSSKLSFVSGSPLFLPSAVFGYSFCLH